jgi:hypothetical protein
VVAEVLNDPSLFEVVFNWVLSDDPLVRMRCADALEKITLEHPEYLQPFKARFLQEIAQSKQREVRWHLAQMLPRLGLSAEERAVAVEVLGDYLNDKSKIVKTFSMQALADLVEQEASLRERVIPILEELSETGSSAMKSRGRKLLRKLRPSASTA